MTALLTIVYYSASTEEPGFEARVQRQIVEANDGRNPIVSVTQKPVPFGLNVCVGERTSCDANAFRQLQIGVEQANSKWIAVAEADALYPPAYFDWEAWGRNPETPAIVTYVPVFILWDRAPGIEGFRRKEWTEGARYYRREWLLHRLARVLGGRTQWSTPEDPHPREIARKRHWGWRTELSQPVVSCKTGKGLRWRTGTVKTERSCPTIPHWGMVDATRARFFHGAIVEEATA